MRIRSTRWLWGIRFTLLAIFLCVAGFSMRAETIPEAPTGEPATGQLLIQGEAIEYLVLIEKNAEHNYRFDDTIRLERPEPSVTLPAGEYRVREVRLRGGYRCHPPQAIGDPETGERREVGWFTVSPDEPYVLVVGAPLKPTLKVYRENRTLRMTYFLYDTSSRAFWGYSPEDFGCGPVANFSVYRGDQLVGRGWLKPDG